jgi:predicted methyltransferase
MRLSVAFLLIITASAGHTENLPLDEKIRAAMAAEIRTEADVVRDGNRRPVETLSFFGLRDDMRVLELLPGGGWYTKILAPVLRDNGELHVAIGTGRVRDNLLNEDGFDKVNVIEVSAAMPSDGEFGARTVGMFAFDAGEFDLVLTFRNMHNFTEEGRANINTAVYDALIPGGLYGVVDHSRRHMEPATRENRRRADVVQIILEAQRAGFDFVDYSDLHYRPDDELRYEVGRKSVTGNSDRFTLLFRRPQ